MRKELRNVRGKRGFRGCLNVGVKMEEEGVISDIHVSSSAGRLCEKDS